MEQKRTGLSYVFTLAKEERGKLSLGMLLAVFSSALSFVPYLVVYQILLLIIKQEVTLPAMLGWAGIGIAAAVLQAILTSFAGICSHTAAFNTMHRIKVRVLEHMSKFNLGFFQEHAPGQIKTTLFDDVDRIETFLAHSTLELAQAIVVPLMMFIFMLRLNWIMALIMLVPMILGIAIPMALMGRYPDLTDEFAGDTEKLNASANEFITAMPVIKMYHLTAEKFEQYRNSLKIYTDCWVKMCESSCNPLSIALVVLDSAILFTLPVGGWLYLRDSLSAASYLLFILLTMCFFTSFLNMVTIAMQSMELGSGLDNVKKIMDIERLPNGYQTHLAEGGNTLSGGEKQRIAIARAILKDAPILLLDESTASLDADNEAKINQALDRLMKGKTVFVIAHRLNTIQNADQIIVLNQGRIEETGTHEELLRKKGHYYEMVQEQQKAREWIVKGA